MGRIFPMGSSNDIFRKYPRTPHVFGSQGTSDDRRLGIKESQLLISDTGLVVEEKVDGANVGIHFGHDQIPILQCRGHVIEGGSHPQFDLLKQWIWMKKDALWAVLRDRFVMFGEWMFAKHNIHYTRLPHYFIEFDIYDKKDDTFLDTETRHSLIGRTGIVSVPVIHRGAVDSEEDLRALIGPSLFYDGPAEGLYLKVERNGRTIGRAKYVRPGFIQEIINDEHWSKKPVVPNELEEGVDIWV